MQSLAGPMVLTLCADQRVVELQAAGLSLPVYNVASGVVVVVEASLM